MYQSHSCEIRPPIRRRYFLALPAPAPLLLLLELFNFRTSARLREQLAGIEQLLRVPRLTHLLHNAQINLAKDQCHLFLLLNSHSVLSCDGASSFSANLQDLVPCLAHAFNLARHLRIEEAQPLQIAIASMEHIPHAQPIAST